MDVTAAVAYKPHSGLELQTVTLDEPQAHEVVVEIKGVGVCHSDLAARDGAIPIPLPAVFGHEGSGVVVAAGSAVTKVQVGDSVVLSFSSCGGCPNCAADQPAYCHQFAPMNYGGVRPDGSSTISGPDGPIKSSFFGQSSFATFALAHERNVVKVGAEAPLALLGPLGCGVQTGAGSVMNTFNCPAGSSLLVLGAGSVGLSAVLGAVVQGCSEIIVSEPNQARRELALSLGATHALDPAAGDLIEQVRAIVPAGVNFALETSGVAAVLAAVPMCIAPHGTLGFVGVPADPTAELSVNVIMAMVIGLQIKGIVEGDSNPDEFIPRLIDLHAQGKFAFDRLITTYPFSKINDAIADQESGATVKAVLVPDAS